MQNLKPYLMELAKLMSKNTLLNKLLNTLTHQLTEDLQRAQDTTKTIVKSLSHAPTAQDLQYAQESI